MFASITRSRARRRGVVLVVILGMLGLLALIGVTFATFSNQSQINARNFAAAQSFPDAAEMMDYALSQLLVDTANPQSVIRGHSLVRDMYGNDAGNNGALLNGFPDGSGAILFQTGQLAPSYVSTGQYTGLIKCVTNIPNNAPAFYGYDFRRWVIRTGPTTGGNPNLGTFTYYGGRTFEILADDANDSSGYRAFYVYGGDDGQPMPPTTPKRAGSTPSIAGYTPAGRAGTWQSTLPTLQFVASNQFPLFLDGRFMRAFNGPGLAGMGYDGVNPPGPHNNPNIPTSQPIPLYANFRYNGNVLSNVLNASNPNYTPTYGPGYGDPNQICGMDEDYDAADLENWFLAVQSADGQVVLPSFHRPGILTKNDWSLQWSSNDTNAIQLQSTRAMSKILRPRRADGHSPISFPDLLPDATTGKITYDVDNDGDGTTDAVWLDLGYPPKRNAEGQLFKPMFAFTIIGLNGKLPLNTAGNLQSRTSTGAGASVFQEFDHTEHYGNSPSEIDLRYALQNAYDPAPGHFYSQKDNAGIATPGTYNQNTGVYTEGTLADGTTPGGIPVAETQLRNILTGTRPFATPGSNNVPLNGDANWVVVDGQLWFLPNNVADVADVPTNGTVYRQTPPVAGRWGEEDAVPQQLVNPNPGYIFNNSVRAGHSIASGGFDARDDDFRTFDMWPSATTGEQADFYDLQGGLGLPVERMRRFVTPVDLSGDGRVVTFNGAAQRGVPRALGADVFGRVSFFRYFRPPGLPLATVNSAYNVPASIGQLPVYPGGPNLDTNNPYHGYASNMNPAKLVGIQNTLLGAAMPSDVDANGQQVPVYGGGVASPTSPQLPTYTGTVNSDLTFISPGLNDADEMNLYVPSRLDSPFGPSDLEWLYRFQDVDGASLNSRLAQLAPISFLNPKDGTRRRRLFALDSWETTNFVWANDNPQGTFPNNSRFSSVGNASFFAVNQAYVNIRPTPTDPAWDFSVQAQPSNNSNSKYPVNTPSLAHRDRRINLNFPIPVSNSPIEPVRQKWIRETYEFLKATLPPKAVDTPEELAQLSQYVVNIVDFRDPDATMTKFVNTDVVVVPATAGTGNTTQGTQATLQFATLTTQPVIRPAYDPNYNENDRFLIQWGMEYQPVAINEVLAFKFQTKIKKADDNPDDANYTTRFFVELVNTLTKDGLNQPPAAPTPATSTSPAGISSCSRRQRRRPA
ncbi:MAG: hypothetical protein U0835_12310 [Isosphaeraceae bacterium]